MDDIAVGTFTRSLVLAVAERTGALSRAGLTVREVPVASSPAQFASLEAREYDAVLTSPDNVLAYRLLDANPLGRRLDVRMTAALDGGLGLTLCVRPHGVVEAIRSFGVDVPASGFAFAGYALLDRLGVEPSDVVTLGATPRRADALLAGDVDATVLNAGNELRAVRAGAAAVARVSDLGPYLGAVVARRADGPAAADRLAAVLVETGDRILARELDDVVLDVAQDRAGMTPEVAAAHLAVVVHPLEGIVRGGAFDAAALETVVRLRSRWSADPGVGGMLDRLDEVVAPIG